jgi:hypothetical protein
LNAPTAYSQQPLIALLSVILKSSVGTQHAVQLLALLNLKTDFVILMCPYSAITDLFQITTNFLMQFVILRRSDWLNSKSE